MRWTAVVNPTAGRGRTRKLLPRLTDAFAGTDLDVDVRVSEDLDDAVRLARAAFDDGRGVAACGGDGSSSGGSAKSAAGGTIAVITVDPSNPYWKAEVDTAKSEISKLGYKSTVEAHGNDPDKQNQFIDAAISQKVKAIILDPAGADESVGAVKKATDAGIPVFQVNAEISAQGIAKSQIVSNNAQGATLGAQESLQP
jgi:ABC-type sugar transport system substrate-binding protein